MASFFDSFQQYHLAIATYFALYQAGYFIPIIDLKKRMLTLKRYYNNPFHDEKISTAEALSYTQTHLERMTANNPQDQLNEVITLTSNLLMAAGGSVSSETVRLGVQKASVQAKNDFRATLSSAISKIYGSCLAVWGKKHPKMLEVFPGGLEIFSSANDNALDGVLEALQEALTNNVAALTPAPGLAAGALATTWSGLYGVLNTAKGKMANAADLRKSALVELKDQLFKNLLLLAGLFPDQEDKADLYHPQYLLENDTPAAPATPPVV